MVGAGVMGSGIAQTLAVVGLEVVCCDVDPAALDQARSLVRSGRFGLERAVARGKLTQAQADATLSRLQWAAVADPATAVADVDLVVEAVPEDLQLKRDLFARLDRCTRPEAVLATNTSGLSIAAVAAATTRPDRVIGWHWASPAPVMPLAEIVVTDQTSEAACRWVVDLARRCGKNPVVVRDNPMTWGHVGNRVYFAALREAQAVVDEGLTDPAGVDRIMTDGFGWPVGPFGMGKGAGTGWEQPPPGGDSSSR